MKPGEGALFPFPAELLPNSGVPVQFFQKRGSGDPAELRRFPVIETAVVQYIK